MVEKNMMIIKKLESNSLQRHTACYPTYMQRQSQLTNAHLSFYFSFHQDRLFSHHNDAQDKLNYFGELRSWLIF